MARKSAARSHPRADALHANKLWFRKIFEHAGMGIAITDWEGRFELCNPAYCALLGYTEEELHRIAFALLVHPEDREENLSEIQRLQAGQVSFFEIENRYVHKDGRPVWVRKWVSVLPDATGKPTHLMALVTDVTERKRIERALRESEERLHHMTDVLPVLIAYIGADCRYQFNNACYERWFGHSREHYQGRHMREVLGEAAYDTLEGHIKTALAGKRCTFEARVPYQGAGTRDVLVHYIPHHTQDGQVVGFVALILDLTERKQAEEAVRRSEERIRTILNTAADAILTIDREGTIQSVNPAAERVFGYSASEMIGQNVKMLIPSPDREAHDGHLARFLQTGESRIMGRGRELEAQRKDGSLFPAELTVSEVGQLGLFTGIVRDITRRKELEREVVEIVSLEQRRIGQDLHDTVAQELTALNLLAYDLAETLRTDPVGASALLDRMARGLERSQHELRAVLRGLVPVAVDAGGLMAALADLADRTRQEGKLACTFECPEPISVTNNVVATQLFLIVQEAVRNAVKHARSRRIRITLVRNGRLRLCVQDDGVGMPAQPTELQGLGLRIMRNRAAIIGATLTLRPAEPTGTMVVCELPRIHDGK